MAQPLPPPVITPLPSLAPPLLPMATFPPPQIRTAPLSSLEAPLLLRSQTASAPPALRPTKQNRPVSPPPIPILFLQPLPYPSLWLLPPPPSALPTHLPSPPSPHPPLV